MGALGYFAGNPAWKVLLVWLVFWWTKLWAGRSKEMKYTFVIPVRNREGLRLHNTLRSILQQRFPRERFEVVVVDYGGEDRLQEELAKNGLRARYIYTNEKGPFNEARAKNVGIQQARGRYIISTNADIVFEENFLAALDALFTVFPESFAMCLRYDFQKEAVEEYGKKVVEKMSDLRGLPSTILRSKWWAGDCQAASKKNFELLRGFNEEFLGWGSLDNDLHSRMELAGKQTFWLNPFTYVAHQNHEQDPGRVKAEGKRNREILERHYPDFRRNQGIEWGAIKP